MTWAQAFSGIDLNSILLDASLVTRLLLLLLGLVGAFAFVRAVVRLVAAGHRSGLLAGLGWVAIIAGLGGALHTGVEAIMAFRRAHAHDILVTAPAMAEAALLLGLGVIVWLVARVGNLGAKRA